MKRFAALAIAGALSACATPYMDLGLFGGVKAYSIDDRTIRVTAERGSKLTSDARLTDYVVLKSAETTLEKGYDGFAFTRNGLLTISEDLTAEAALFTYAELETAPEGPRYYDAREVMRNLGPRYGVSAE